jgi:hypothetical protein
MKWLSGFKMDKYRDEIKNLSDVCSKLNAGVSVFNEVLKNTAQSDLEKESMLLKLDLLKNDILHSSMKMKHNIKELIDLIEVENDL